MLCSPLDGVIIDINSKLERNREFNVQKDVNIEGIRTVRFNEDDEYFYIMCNRYHGILGFIVLKIHSKPPFKRTFIIKWKNKLDVNDTSMYLCKN